MQLHIRDLTKQYDYRNVFSGLSLDILKSNHIAVTGSNGSGKSTFLKIVSGFLSPSEGEIKYSIDNKNISRDSIWSHLSYTGPYISLIPTYTVHEFLKFYLKMRSFRGEMDMNELLERINLFKHREKRLSSLSSGMRQRMKLGLTLYTDSDLILLDEPGTNLDNENFQWFSDALETDDIQETTCIIASNDRKDLQTCSREINMNDY